MTEQPKPLADIQNSAESRTVSDDYVPITTAQLKALCEAAPHLDFEDHTGEWESYYEPTLD